MDNFNDNKPLVSVLIPTYNEKKYFQSALNSVLNQTYENIEIIICDDSTTNDIEKIIEDYVIKYENVKYYNNNGPLGNRGALNLEKCFRLCNGKYVNFLMQDDLFNERKIEKMVKCFIENENVSLVTSYRKLIDENGDIMPDWNTTVPFVKQTSLFKGEELGKYILENLNNVIGEPTTAMFRREDIKDQIATYGGHTMRCLVDLAIWIKALQKGDAIYISEPLSCFRIHGNQKTFDDIVKIWGELEWYYLIAHSYEIKHFLDRESFIKALKTWSNNNISKIYEANKIFEKDDYEVKEARICMYQCYKNALKHFMNII